MERTEHYAAIAWLNDADIYCQRYVVSLINRHYAGGWTQFLADA